MNLTTESAIHPPFTQGATVNIQKAATFPVTMSYQALNTLDAFLVEESTELMVCVVRPHRKGSGPAIITVGLMLEVLAETLRVAEASLTSKAYETEETITIFVSLPAINEVRDYLIEEGYEPMAAPRAAFEQAAAAAAVEMASR